MGFYGLRVFTVFGFAVLGFSASALADEQCDTRLGSDGRPVTTCSGEEMVPQPMTPDQKERERKLGDGWSEEVIGNPPPDCDPALDACPQGDEMIYGDGMLPDPGLGVE